MNGRTSSVLYTRGVFEFVNSTTINSQKSIYYIPVHSVRPYFPITRKSIFEFVLQIFSFLHLLDQRIFCDTFVLSIVTLKFHFMTFSVCIHRLVQYTYSSKFSYNSMVRQLHRFVASTMSNLSQCLIATTHSAEKINKFRNKMKLSKGLPFRCVCPILKTVKDKQTSCM